jgi:peptide/nickel transport system substrate-binding protein
MMRHLGVLLGLVLLGLGPIATPVGAQEPRRGGVLVIATADDPPHYDAHQTQSFVIAQPTGPVFSTLLQFDPKKYPEIIGDLATAWKVSPDGLAYTFTLRPHVKFHDGATLTSADVKASLERVKTAPAGVVSAWAHLFRTVERIDTPDALTVVFLLSRPTPSFLTHMANPFLHIHRKAILDQDPLAPKTKMIGTGPFRFKGHTPGQSLEFERFDGYFVPGRPYLDGIRFSIIRDTNARASALIAGRADAEIRDLPPLVIEQIEASARGRVTIVRTDWLSILDLAFDVNKKPFDDPKVRLAINCGVDGYGLINALGPIAGARHPSKWGRPNSFWEMPDERFQKLPCWGTDAEANRKRASELLAGYPGGLKLKLTNRNVPHPYITLGVYYIEQLKRVGIDVAHNLVDTSTWTSALRNLGEGEMVISTNPPPYDDPDAFFGARIPGASTNHSQYKDPEVVRLFDQQSRELDANKRRELVWQLESRIWEHAYWGKGMWPTKHYVLARRIQNYTPHPTHFTNVKFQDVWLSQ